MSLRLDATEASRVRFELARELAERCPPELGHEIAVSGSVARGIADDDSDIELNFWTDETPPVDAREAWLREMGADELVADAFPGADGTAWVICFLRGIQIEAGWQSVDAQDQIVQRLAAGEIVDHRRLIVADMLRNAVALRGGKLLLEWQSQLAAYPEPLRERLIAESIERWSWPTFHRALARRGERLAITSRLLVDVYAALRILCALNRRWEPDWKWLRQVEQDLALAPRDLATRIDSVFTADDPNRAIDLCFELVLDTLRLLPSSDNVSGAIAVAEGVLERNTP